ncbi:VP12 [Banna-like virus strain Balaton/2010/HUN]|nr:VP12 [Banna-like virus strain Balaton/2010/HUN]
MPLQMQSVNCCPDRFVCIHKTSLMIILLISATVTVVDQLFQKLDFNENSRYVVSTIVDGVNAVIISAMAIFGLNNLNKLRYTNIPSHLLEQEMTTISPQVKVINEENHNDKKHKNKINNKEIDEPVETSYTNLYPIIPSAPQDPANLLIDQRTGQTIILTNTQMDQIYKTSVNPATAHKVTN